MRQRPGQYQPKRNRWALGARANVPAPLEIHDRAPAPASLGRIELDLTNAGCSITREEHVRPCLPEISAYCFHVRCAVGGKGRAVNAAHAVD